ncbi:aminoglycoside phosphotransferase [Streptomyces sp. NPDC055099]
MPIKHLDKIPPTVLDVIEDRSGRVLQAHTVTGGLNRAITARVRTDVETLFIKALPADHPRVRTQSREAAINPYVPGIAPQLVWQAVDTNWHILGYAHIEARHANWKPGTEDVEPTLDVMEELAERPLPPVEVKRMTDRMRPYAESEELHLFDGSALLHTRWNPKNVLVRDGGARLVNWARASLGAAWIDPALWVLRLIAAGHDPEQAEFAASGHEAWRHASYEALWAFSRAQARRWDSVAAQSADEGSQLMQQAARTWRDYRT